MMKIVIMFLALVATSCLSSSAQMVSYILQESLTKSQLDSTLSATGFSLPIPPSYDVEVYKVIYKTPYIHIDSLVNASGVVVFPKNTPCPSALGSFGHGTTTKRTQVPTYETGVRRVGYFFAGIGGVVTALPDELGLGDSDPSVIIHPYHTAFHAGYGTVNLFRAARELADILEIPLNGEVLLTGYSQGGYTSMAANKLIQEEYSGEFNVVACAPMSGAYDLNVTMVDLMLDTMPYASPAYLPYIVLGYHSVYESLQQKYPTPSHFLKSPYDSILPPLYYSKDYTWREINEYCDSVPRRMFIDSVVNEFANDMNHPLRVALAENDLLGWAPQNPLKMFYCVGDEQVSYLNPIRADSVFRANGAPNIEIQDFGNFDHNGCVQPALTSASLYMLGKLTPCDNTGIIARNGFVFEIFPNPSTGQLTISKPEGVCDLNIYNVNGQRIFSQRLMATSEQADISTLPCGFYILELRDNKGAFARKSLVRE